MRNKLTIWIAIAAVAGVLAGYLANTLADDPASAADIAGYFSILADIFLRLIKMIIAPLVFATLVVGHRRHRATPRRSAASASRRWAGLSPPRWFR